MESEYKIFRAFCAVSIVMLCILLVTTGILTANYRTEQTVFGKKYDTVQIYEKEGGALINTAGKISSIETKDIIKKLDILSYTVFAPVNNVIELIKTAFRAISSV